MAPVRLEVVIESRIAAEILWEKRQMLRSRCTLTFSTLPLMLGRALSMYGPATSNIRTAPSTMLVSPRWVSGEITFFPRLCTTLLQVKHDFLRALKVDMPVGMK